MFLAFVKYFFPSSTTFLLQSLTEDAVSLLLQLIDEEQKKKGETSCTEPLTVQVAACIVALCGWATRYQESLIFQNKTIKSFCWR